MTTATHLIRSLKLAPHPEGGFYREVYRSDETLPPAVLPERYSGPRSFSTSIYFLLRSRDVSRFHRLASDELWYFHAGSPLTVHVIDPKGRYTAHRLGINASRKQQPQLVVGRNHWFAATVDLPRCYTLVGCTVAPGFDFADFEMAEQAPLIRLCPKKAALIRRLT